MRRALPRSIVALALLVIGCGDQVIGDLPAAGTQGDSTTAGDPPADSSEGPPPAPEVCDGVDNDLDGLVDEYAPDNELCDGCVLMEAKDQAWWVCPQELPWQSAQDHCASLGATLAIVPTQETQDFLQVAVGEGWFWLGARQAENEGAWSWVDGTPLSYANWGTTQPDDTAPGQDCLRLTFGIVDEGWFDGAWDDFFCEDAHRVMCSAPL